MILVSACSNPHLYELAGPASNKIRITGRIKNDNDSVMIYWPGTSILVRFSGRELKAKLKDEYGENYFNVIIDGEDKRHIKLDSLKHYYTLASNLSEGEHTVELVKRTEWDKGSTCFYGVEVAGKLHALPPKNNRIIEFFGNSITAGYAIEDYSGGDSADSTYTNNYYTYGALTARHFKADYYGIVKSGIGIMLSWFPLIMPEMYDRLNPTDSLSKWNFKNVTPNVVVINLFQNDSWLVKNPDHPSFALRFGHKAPDSNKIVSSYKSFVEKIREVYPEASIICVLGPMDAMRKDSPWPGYIKQAVEQLHDKKIYTHFFPYTKKAGHPRKEDNAIMAESLIEFIEKNVEW